MTNCSLHQHKTGSGSSINPLINTWTKHETNCLRRLNPVPEVPKLCIIGTDQRKLSCNLMDGLLGPVCSVFSRKLLPTVSGRS